MKTISTTNKLVIAITALTFGLGSATTFAMDVNSPLNRGTAALLQKEYGKAVSLFTEAVQLDPKDVLAYRGRADAYEAKGDHDQAIADYTEVIRQSPPSETVFLAQAYNGRSDAYEAKGDHEHAKADHEKAVALEPQIAPRTFGSFSEGLGAGFPFLFKASLDTIEAAFSPQSSTEPPQGRMEAVKQAWARIWHDTWEVGNGASRTGFVCGVMLFLSVVWGAQKAVKKKKEAKVDAAGGCSSPS